MSKTTQNRSTIILSGPPKDVERNANQLLAEDPHLDIGTSSTVLDSEGQVHLTLVLVREPDWEYVTTPDAPVPAHTPPGTPIGYGQE